MPSGTAVPTQPSALPLNPSTDPRDVPESSAESLEDPDTSSEQGPADARMQRTGVSDRSHEAAADAAVEAAARAAGAGSKAGAADQAAVDGVGYWQVAWLYLTSLLKLGEAYEVAGSHEDAVHAFKEGLELVCHTLLSMQLPGACDQQIHVDHACCPSSLHILSVTLHGCYNK